MCQIYKMNWNLQNESQRGKENDVWNLYLSASNSGYDISIAPGTSFAASSRLNQNNDCGQLILGVLERLKDNCARPFTVSPAWIDELRRDGEEEAAEAGLSRTKWAMWWRRPSQLCRASCRWTPSPVRQNSPLPQNWDTSSEASPTSRPNMWVFSLKTLGATRQDVNILVK